MAPPHPLNERQAKARSLSEGLVRTRTTALLSVDETDRALERSITYRGPGR
jgi:hypothetical protein